MMSLICPNCKKNSLILVSDGIYRCTNCGYTGKSNFKESIFKQG